MRIKLFLLWLFFEDILRCTLGINLYSYEWVNYTYYCYKLLNDNCCNIFTIIHTTSFNILILLKCLRKNWIIKFRPTSCKTSFWRLSWIFAKHIEFYKLENDILCLFYSFSDDDDTGYHKENEQQKLVSKYFCTIKSFLC